MLTYHPVLEVKVELRSAVEDNVEADHNQEGDVEGSNGRFGMKVSIKCDEHPGRKYQNPRYAAQGDLH